MRTRIAESREILRLALRYSIANRRRSAFAILAVGVCFVSCCFLTLFTRGVGEQVVRDTINTLTGHMLIVAMDYNSEKIEARTFSSKELRGLTSGYRKTERVTSSCVVMSERKSYPVKLVGISSSEEAGLSFISETIVEGSKALEVGGSGALVGKKLLETLKTGIGKRLAILVRGPDGKDRNFSARIIGVFDDELERTELGYLFLDRTYLQKMLGIGEEVTEISIHVNNSDDVVPTVSKLNNEFDKFSANLKILPWFEKEPLSHALTQVQSKMRRLWYSLVSLMVACCIANAMYMAVYERRRELGLLAALGLSPSQIRIAVLVEAFAVVTIGCLVGLILTQSLLIICGGKINLSLFARGVQHLGFSSTVVLSNRWSDYYAIFASLVIGGLLSTIWPAIKASRVTPDSALRST